MRLYAIYTRDAATEEGVRMVRQGFSWFAFLLPPVWALTQHLWLAALGWLAGVLALAGLALVIGGDAVAWLYVLLALYFGFAGAEIAGFGLRRRGYRFGGEVAADTLIGAERAYFARLPAAGAEPAP